jgi:hypothetical protein
MLIGKDTAIRTPEFHQKKERQRKFRIAAGIILFVILVGAPIYLLRNTHFLISQIEIKGNNVTKSELIQEIISKNIEGNYAWIIPKSNILLYPKHNIQTELLATVPRFNNVDIRLENTRTLVVEVSERTPFALYCKDVQDVLNPAGCFFLDASGYIFSEAPAFSGGVYQVFSSEPSFEEPLRQRFLDPQTFGKLPEFVDSLGKIGVFSKALVDKDDEFHVVLANGAVIMWKKTQDLENIHSNLESFMKDPNLNSNNKTLDRILYLDLRFGNKIFYKFRDELGV